jgi:hypothetical protein
LLPDAEVVVLEQLRCDASGIEVELVDQQHVRPHAVDVFGHRRGLHIAGRRQIVDQFRYGTSYRPSVSGS